MFIRKYAKTDNSQIKTKKCIKEEVKIRKEKKKKKKNQPTVVPALCIE